MAAEFGDEPTIGSDGFWNETMAKGEVKCIHANGDNGQLILSGSTNVRVWDARTGHNIQTLMMTPRTAVRCMASSEARSGSSTAVWCGHSDGRVSQLTVPDPPQWGPETNRAGGGGGGGGEVPPAAIAHQFGAHRSAVTAITFTDCNREVWTGSDHGTIRCWGADAVAAGEPARCVVQDCNLNHQPHSDSHICWCP